MADETIDQNQEQESTEQAQTDDTKSFTQSELDSYTDSKISKALEKQKAKFDEQLAKAVEDGKSEGQKLAKMSAQEKADAEEQERLAKLDEREQELNKRELTANVGDILTEKGLPKELANSLVGLGDADKISAVVDVVQKSIEQGVNNGVKERMRQDPPTNGGSNLNETDDPFAKVLNQYK